MPAAALRLAPVSPVSSTPRRDAGGAPKLADATAVAPPDGYYAAAQGRQGVELLRSLGEITRRGHRDLGYAQARDAMFSLVHDLDGDDRVRDVYSGQLRANIDGRRSAYERKLNAEHTWPQSLGAAGIARSDLHQLLPSDVEANNKRGNHPYGPVSGRVEWQTPHADAPANSSRLGSDARGRTVFEPRASVRGDIARGLLYFYTRYNDDRPPRYSNRNFAQELPRLLEWHGADPVDANERARNDAIFALQGNRNPYVDHPEFVAAAKSGFAG